MLKLLLERAVLGLVLGVMLLFVGVVWPVIIGSLVAVILLVLVLAGLDHGIRRLFRLRNEHPVTAEQVRIAVSVPFAIAAIAAPVRAGILMAGEGFGIPLLSGLPPPVGWIDAGTAGCGILLGAALGGRSLAALLREHRQVANLPTSKARSAAIGLAELRGVARAVAPEARQVRCEGPALKDPPSEAILFVVKRLIRGASDGSATGSFIHEAKTPFYLEDESGRILVDPRDACFWDAATSSFLERFSAFWQRFPRILLTRRVERRSLGFMNVEETRTLMPGDPVYLVGSVEPNPAAPPDAADSDRLMVRPAILGAVKSGFLDRWVPYLKHSRDHDIHQVFILADTTEAGAGGFLRLGLRRACVHMALWIVPAAWVFVRELTRW